MNEKIKTYNMIIPCCFYSGQVYVDPKHRDIFFNIGVFYLFRGEQRLKIASVNVRAVFVPVEVSFFAHERHEPIIAKMKLGL